MWPSFSDSHWYCSYDLTFTFMHLYHAFGGYFDPKQFNLLHGQCHSCHLVLKGFWLVCYCMLSYCSGLHWVCRAVSWSNWTQNRTFMSIREECGRKLLWDKPCREKLSPCFPVSHPRHPCAPIHGISLMRVEMSAMIHSERKRETGRRTKGFYAACVVFSPCLYSGRFVTWLVDPLTYFHTWICLGIIFSKEQSAYIAWSGVVCWRTNCWG